MTINDKVIKYLVKRGWNEATAIRMVNKDLKSVINCHPYATPAKLAGIIIYY